MLAEVLVLFSFLLSLTLQLRNERIEGYEDARLT